jgi:hypothetical protein
MNNKTAWAIVSLATATFSVSALLPTAITNAIDNNTVKVHAGGENSTNPLAAYIPNAGTYKLVRAKV